MLPARTAGRPASRSTRQVSVEVVDFPLLPVIPITGRPAARTSARKRLTLVVTSTPRRAASTRSGWSRRMPGERTSRSTPSRAAAIPEPIARSRSSGTVPGAGGSSRKTRGGRPPQRRIASQTERPSAPAPKTPTRRSVSFEIPVKDIGPVGRDAVMGTHGQLAADQLVGIVEAGGDLLGEPAQRRQIGIRVAPGGEPEGGGDLVRRAHAVPRLVIPLAQELAHPGEILRVRERIDAEDVRQRRVVQPRGEQDGSEHALGAVAAPAAAEAPLEPEVGVARGHGAEPLWIRGEGLGDA